MSGGGKQRVLQRLLQVDDLLGHTTFTTAQWRVPWRKTGAKKLFKL
ncbi:MAG: hypothetical protein II040_05145 [Muribaculaceae bacterium]|nr:hypothetical protein [Muribaculaceae bacterium]